MKDYFYVNPSKLMEFNKVLDGSDIKMLWGIMYCLSITGNEWFVNNATSREMLKEIGFDKAPERISNILGSLTRKGVLKKISNGVYSLIEGLYINADKVNN